MKILDFNFDFEKFKQNKSEFVELFKMQAIKENEKLFDYIDYNNDELFLEPLMFFKYLGESNLVFDLHQILSYPSEENNFFSEINLLSDSIGVITLPQVGYLKVGRPLETFVIISINNLEYELKDKSGNTYRTTLFPFERIDNTNIKISHDIPFIMSNYFEATFSQTIIETVKIQKKHINYSFDFFKTYMPEFYNLLILSVKEISIYSSTNLVSFAARRYQGVGFLNSGDKLRSKCFFIEDISHQCGHVIFSYLTLHENEFLKTEMDAPFKKYSNIDQESREVYGVFHGLFTYTTILNSLDRAFDAKIFTKDELHEAIGRFGFYMNKFRLDLFLMNNHEIFTPLGFEYYNQFLTGYWNLFEKYKKLLMGLDYSNQPYIFEYDSFLMYNPKSYYMNALN